MTGPFLGRFRLYLIDSNKVISSKVAKFGLMDIVELHGDILQPWGATWDPWSCLFSNKSCQYQLFHMAPIVMKPYSCLRKHEAYNLHSFSNLYGWMISTNLFTESGNYVPYKIFLWISLCLATEKVCAPHQAEENLNKLMYKPYIEHT